MKTHVSTPSHAYNLSNLEARFREYLGAVINLKAVSIKNYVSDMRHFLGWYSTTTAEATDSFDPSLLTRDHIENYRRYLVSGDLPTRTVNRRLSSVRAFCAYLVSQNLLQANPAKGVMNLGSKKPQKHHFSLSGLAAENERDFREYLESQSGLNSAEIQRTVNHISDYLSVTQVSHD